ncbi:MAG: ribosome small subunit-dependent GTPase A [Lysobacterales bacterium]
MTEPATAESLRSIGWLGDPADALRELPAGCALARVVAQHRSGYRVHDGTRELAVQTPATLLRKGADPLSRPGVGDWLMFRRLPEPMIERVLPRRTALIRGAAGESRARQLIAANVDVVFIVCGLDGDYNLRRIERYLVLTRSSGAQPVVVLTKDDLSPTNAEQLIEVTTLSGPDTPVLAVNARTLEAGRALLAFLPAGTTAVLVGSSGAGKSTLTNSLLGIDRQATAEVRVHDSRGRHTTTHRALLPLPSGACLIDTPGMRELKLTGDEDVAAATFDDIDALLGTCRFSDCGHGNEPGCAIRAALESGAVPAERWAHYLKLSEEAAAASASLAQRQDDKRNEKVANRALGKRLVEKYGHR